MARPHGRLVAWRQSTGDPLPRPENIARLKDEIDAGFVAGQADRGRLSLT